MGGVLASTAGPAEPGPRGVVRMAALAAGMLIAQQVAGKATRDAFFLSQFDVEALPVASGAAACASMVGVVAFARAMARRSPARVVPTALGVSAALLVLEWALSRVAPRAAAVALYLHMALFGATLVSGFWSLLSERFDPHRAKRAMGTVGTGASLGAVAGGFATWRVAPLVPLPYMILGLGLLSALCLVVVARLSRTDGPAAPSRDSADETPDASAWRLVRDVGYLRGLAALVALCAFSEALLDFVFSASAAMRYGRGPALVGFFAAFQAGVGLTGLAVQAGAVRWSLGRLGLAGTLALHSGAVAAAGAGVVALPRFAAVVLLRGAEAVLRNSLFRSAYELLYTPLAPQRKRPTKAIVDVGFDRFGTIAGSGVVLLILAATGDGIPVRILVAVASVASMGMLVLCVRFQRAYVGALVDSLRTGRVRLDEDDVVDASTRRAVETAAIPSNVPSARTFGAAETALGPSADLVLRRAEDLRSGDPARIRVALGGDGLPPALVAFAVPLLARDDLFGDLLPPLRKAAGACTGQLVDALLDESLDPVVRRRIPRVLVAAPHRRTVDGLFAALSADRFDVRFRCAQALARLRQRQPGMTVPADAAFAAARRELDAGHAADRTGPLLDYVFALFSLVLEREPLDIALRAIRGRDEVLRGTALEYLENVLPPPVRASLWPRLGVQRPIASGRSALDMREELLRSSSRWKKVEGELSTGPGR